MSHHKCDQSVPNSTGSDDTDNSETIVISRREWEDMCNRLAELRKAVAEREWEDMGNMFPKLWKKVAQFEPETPDLSELTVDESITKPQTPDIAEKSTEQIVPIDVGGTVQNEGHNMRQIEDSDSSDGEYEIVKDQNHCGFQNVGSDSSDGEYLFPGSKFVSNERIGQCLYNAGYQFFNNKTQENVYTRQHRRPHHRNNWELGRFEKSKQEIGWSNERKRCSRKLSPEYEVTRVRKIFGSSTDDIEELSRKLNGVCFPDRFQMFHSPHPSQ